MSTATVLANGAYFAAEKSLAVLPKYWKGNGAAMGVIYAHGYGGDALEPRDAVAKTGLYNIIDAVADAGFPVLSVDFAGQQWGNDTAIARMGSAKTYLQGTLGAKAGPIAIIGQSMGHLVSINYAAANRSSVACVVAQIPVCDLQDIYGQSAYTASINTAYGGSYSDATAGPTHNPTKLALAGALNGLPWRGYSISDDVVATYSKVVNFASTVGSTASLVTLPGTGGHNWSTVAKIDPADVVAFIQANQT